MEKFSEVNLGISDATADIYEDSIPYVTIKQGDKEITLTSAEIQQINYEFEIIEYQHFIDEMWDEEDAGFTLTSDQKRDIAEDMLDYIENNGTEYESEELLSLFGQIRSERDDAYEDI